ncbi:MAG: hypothetical protein Q7T57_02790 [Dehalococcoidales bacterium]|nr:hypothetical protein [Dehalococcoidales bacterium]
MLKPNLPSPPTPKFPMPHLMKKAPHEDAGELVHDGVLGNLEAVGGAACEALDIPFDATVKIKGPHRLVDGGLDFGVDTAMNAVKKITRF